MEQSSLFRAIMNRKDFLEKHGLRPRKYSIRSKVQVLETTEGRFVVKPCDCSKMSIYQYLESRDFHAFPKYYNDMTDGYEITQYVDDIAVPKEQRLEDMMYLLSILHNKTTFYKDFSLDETKALYEELGGKIYYLEQYYHDLQDMIEMEIYMSPGDYLLIRNISKIYYLLYLAHNQLEKWYEKMKEKGKMRYVMTHRALDPSHLIENQSLYFVSWDLAKIDLPIYDLYDFYQKNYYDVNFEHLYQIYQSKYKLLEEEELLFSVLLTIPEKITLDRDEVEKTKKVYRLLEYVDRTVYLFQKEPTPV